MFSLHRAGAARPGESRPSRGAIVGAEDYAFLAHLLESGLLAVGSGIDPVQIDAYWSGDIGIPAPIDADVATYLLRADSDALIRAALWVVRGHFAVSDPSRIAYARRSLAVRPGSACTVRAARLACPDVAPRAGP